MILGPHHRKSHTFSRSLLMLLCVYYIATVILLEPTLGIIDPSTGLECIPAPSSAPTKAPTQAPTMSPTPCPDMMSCSQQGTIPPPPDKATVPPTPAPTQPPVPDVLQGPFYQNPANLCPYGFHQNYTWFFNSTYCVYEGFVRTCVKCPKGTYHPYEANHLVNLTSCVSCPSGKANSHKGQVSCQDCYAGFYAANCSTFCSPCPPNSSSSRFSGSISECFCQEGFYGTPWFNMSCLPCQEGLICKKNSTDAVIPQGYYFLEGQAEVIMCPNQDACMESFLSKGGTVCSSLYSGDRCASCIYGVSYRSGSACKRCPPIVVTITVTASIILGFVFVCYRLSLSSGKVPADLRLLTIQQSPSHCNSSQLLQ
jgi:hypothetical protein